MLKRRWPVPAVVLIAAGFVAGLLVHIPVNSLWVPVIAALGASLLTALATIGMEYVRGRNASVAQEGLQHEAYERLLVASAQFIQLLSTIRVLRSLTTGVTPSGGIRDSMSPLHRETEPLRDAWSLVWLRGSQEAIIAANQLITKTTPALDLATAAGKGRVAFLSAIVGEKWTPEEDKEFSEALRQVGLARRDFAQVARKELGAGTVDLFGGADQPTSAEPESE